MLAGSGLSWQDDESYELRAGDCLVHRVGEAHLPRAGVSWLFPTQVETVAYGTRDPNDIPFCPRSNKVYLRGIGVLGRIERLEYWDGEP